MRKSLGVKSGAFLFVGQALSYLLEVSKGFEHGRIRLPILRFWGNRSASLSVAILARLFLLLIKISFLSGKLADDINRGTEDTEKIH